MAAVCATPQVLVSFRFRLVTGLEGAGMGSSRSSADALNRAQELIYDAWEATSAARRTALARQALKISPLCADAYVLLAERTPPGSDAEFDLLRKGVEAGEAALGPAAFRDDVGDFWGLLETRPYMRARLFLSRALWLRGERTESIAHLRDMLRLNPNDNQGVRYILAAHLLETDQNDDANELLQAYPDEASAAWSWAAALIAFRREGDTPRSRKMLREALQENAHVPAFLMGVRPMPKSLPPYMSPGEEDEAIFYVEEFGYGWQRSPDALDWLREHESASLRPRSASAKRSRPRQR